MDPETGGCLEASLGAFLPGDNGDRQRQDTGPDRTKQTLQWRLVALQERNLGQPKCNLRWGESRLGAGGQR